MMARGAAALRANCQPGFDLVYPFLYETSDLDINKVGFIIAQVRNRANDMAPNAELFRKMDPFVCQLLSKEDSSQFTVPIIRRYMRHQKTVRRPSMLTNGPSSHRNDFWCSGIGPGIFQPVDEGNSEAQEKWATLLGETDTWGGVFSTLEAPRVRRLHYPAGGADIAHFDAWVSPSHIPVSAR